jgi:hypothetical protein
MNVWLVLGALLAVGCVLVVALPFLRRPGLAVAADRLDQLDAREQRRLELAEERDRTLAALKELEFDHRTGKISDEDYRSLVGPLRRRAADTLRALEPSRKPAAETAAAHEPRPNRDIPPADDDKVHARR